MRIDCWKLLATAGLTLGLIPATTHAEEEEEVIPFPITSIEANLAVERPELPQIGSPAPEFTLPNAGGEEITLEDLRMAVPTLLVFYTGGWNPWCWNQLLEYGQRLDEIMESGIQLVAISPESLEQQNRTQEELDLQFEMLYDRDNLIAQSFGLGWQFDPADWTVWRPRIQASRNTDLGEDPPPLPVPSLILVDPEGKVQWTSLSLDWEERPSVEDIAQAVAEWRQRIEQPIPERFME